MAGRISPRCTAPSPGRAMRELPVVVSRAHVSLAVPQTNQKVKEHSMRGSCQVPASVDSHTVESFQYHPLDPSKNEIRLLRISPALNSDGPIRCHLFHTSLDTAPPYQALSYAWGDKSTSHGILINQGSVNVTLNLKNALLRLRPKAGEEELIIWVDAICIDQQNIPERNLQTGKMRMIYRNANKTAVWIGSQHNGSDRALKLARDLNSCSKEKVGTILKDQSRKVDIEALVIMFRRQYWWRIWVVQEISCSKDTTIYCGDDAIPWQDLENVVDIMKREQHYIYAIYYKHLSKPHTLMHGGPRSLQLSRYSCSASTHAPLLELLLSHKSKKSTDPKDKVYALVGISSSRNTFGNIDYSLSMREVFTHTARHIITTTQKLDVICVKQHDEQHFNLPSWVPNWTRSPIQHGQATIGLHHHTPSFTAAGDSLALVSFTRDGYGLMAKGIIIDRIKAVGIPFKRHGPPSDILSGLHAYDNWWKIFSGYRDSSIDTEVEFARIISCGNWNFGEKSIFQERLRGIYNLMQHQLVRHAPDSRTRYEAGAGEASKVELEEETTPKEQKEQMAAILSANLTMNKRRLFISSRNIAGLVPWNAEPGDIICVMHGCRFPVILRTVGSHYVLIGESYVEGYMDGEAMVGLHEGSFKSNTFEIL